MTVRPVLNNGTHRWCVSYHDAGVRRRRFFAAEDDARAFARTREEFAASAAQEWVEIPPRARAELVALYQDAQRLGLSPRQLWDEYTSGQRRTDLAPADVAPITLRAAIHELIAAKGKANRRASYVQELGRCLLQFAQGRETVPIHTIQAADLERWLDRRARTPATRASLIGKLGSLFTFARRRGWVRADPIAALERPSLQHRPPRILTLDEARRLLAWADQTAPKPFLAWLVLGLFAGVRPEEADHIAWPAIDLDRAILRIDPEGSKVRQRRLVHLEPAAVHWLTRCQGAPLPLPAVTRRRWQRRARDHMGWPQWPQDVLRHTAASMLLARHQDAGKVALELGNSPAMLFRHYRELVEKPTAEEFFAIRST